MLPLQARRAPRFGGTRRPLATFSLRLLHQAKAGMGRHIGAAVPGRQRGARAAAPESKVSREPADLPQEA